MFIKDSVNSMSNAIGGYYQKSLNQLGSTATAWKVLRNDINFFEKICILQKANIDFFNVCRGTTQLTQLANKLETAFLANLAEIFVTIQEWLKPYNANSVHAGALLAKLTDEYAPLLESEKISKVQIEAHLKDILGHFISNLGDASKGRQFGYHSSSEFLNHLQKHINQSLPRRCETFSEEAKNLNLAQKVGNIPLKSISWAQLAANRAFNYVSVATWISYGSEWGFIDTARLASQIGKVSCFAWVNQIEFYKAFKCSLVVAYGALLADSTSRLYQKMFRANDPSLGPKAKHNAPWETVTNVAECAFHSIGAFGVLKSNPAMVTLSLIAAKLTGSVASVSKEYDTFDTPKEHGVAKPSLTGRIFTKVADILSPVTHQRHVAAVLNKISRIFASVIEGLYQINDLEKDGFYKFYKAIVPTMSLIDGVRALNNKTAWFATCRPQFEWHMEVISASKIFGSVPNWIVRNPKTQNFEVRTPLHKWNHEKKVYELKWNEVQGWLTACGDFSNLLDTAKFMRTNQIYHFNSIVEFGRKISESRIPLFGAQVKDVPILQQVYKTPKYLTGVVGIVIDMAHQLYRYGIKGEKSAFNWENSFKFGENIGKIALISWDASNSIYFDAIGCFTGNTGLIKYWISQYKARDRFNSPTA